MLMNVNFLASAMAMVLGAVSIAALPTVSDGARAKQDATRPTSFTDMTAVGTPIRSAPADPAIAHALEQISSRQIQSTIETLVAFHTRNTLSSMETDLPENQGIRAAADRIESEFKRY